MLLLGTVCGFEIYLSTGFVGVTRKARATAFYHGCICHGDSATPGVRVWISGPESLATGQQGLYRVSVAKSSNIAAGFNVASFRGALGVVDSTGTRLLRPDPSDSLELTHSFPKLSHGRDTISWSFFYRAPASASFFDTLYSCGNSVDTSLDPTGDLWNFGENFRVKVTPSVSVKEGMLLAHAFSLLGNYPNPFNPSTRIRFKLPNGGQYNVALRVFDATGQEVATVLDEEVDGGEHEVTFDAEVVNRQPPGGQNDAGMASGVYFYGLEAKAVQGKGEFRGFGKMLLLK